MGRESSVNRTYNATANTFKAAMKLTVQCVVTGVCTVQRECKRGDGPRHPMHDGIERVNLQNVAYVLFKSCI